MAYEPTTHPHPRFARFHPLPAGEAVRSVAAFLAEHFKGSLEGLQHIGHGEWSRAFTFRCDGGEYVARFSATHEDFVKDRRAMAHAGPNLPMPKIQRILARCDS